MMMQSGESLPTPSSNAGSAGINQHPDEQLSQKKDIHMGTGSADSKEDWSFEDHTRPREVDSGPVEKESARPYDRERQRDSIRAIVTCSSVGLFILTIFFAGIVVMGVGSWTNAKDFVQMVLPSETGLVGSVVGFYFGSHKNE